MELSPTSKSSRQSYHDVPYYQQAHRHPWWSTHPSQQNNKKRQQQETHCPHIPHQPDERLLFSWHHPSLESTAPASCGLSITRRLQDQGLWRPDYLVIAPHQVFNCTKLFFYALWRLVHSSLNAPQHMCEYTQQRFLHSIGRWPWWWWKYIIIY